MKRYLLPVLALILSGCATDHRKPAEPETWTPPPLAEVEPQRVVDGSLFSASLSSSLYEDRMAYRAGDILTVVLDEKTRSKKSSGTSLNKGSNVKFPGPSILGTQYGDSEAGLNRSFKGDGSSSQENMLDGSITVTVLKVMPNRTLLVRGEKWLTLNQGDEYIRVSGLLRPEDITQNNTVSSQRLANARLVYSGEGPLADANEAGWLTRFFNGPVMPI